MKAEMSMSFIAFMLLAVVLPAHANNIQVSATTITGVNTAEDYVYVQFDLSWENSWRDDINWDAAWVFVKYKKTGNSEWDHAYLNTTAGNHNIPSGYACSVGLSGSAALGVFIYRNATGSGSNNLSTVQLRWEYGENGLSDGDQVTVKIFAIEMVYAAQGAFYVGDTNGDQTNCFHDGDDTGPYLVNSENAITVGSNDGELYYDDDNGSGGDRNGPVPADFPKGYNAFYCMKYEISQGQWVDFFNTLTDAQKTNRDITGSPGKNSDAVVYRNTISWSSGDATCTRPDRACNYLSWADGCAFADWAGLRPMTELEFEKICRGNQNVADNEMPWGENNAGWVDTISGTEDGTETATGWGAQNMCYAGYTFTGGDGGQGPLRCGIFASSSTSRLNAGASYDGVMELAGNVWERIVSVSNATGRSFTGASGDGSLDTNGDANVINWPGTDAIGAGFRGGSWLESATLGRTSCRQDAGYTDTNRGNNYGFRAIRLAP